MAGMTMDGQLDKDALDRFITGNYGEDMFKGDCRKPMRDGSCVLDYEHRGRHSTVGFYCDACGKMRRGTPEGFAYDTDGVLDVTFCWFCVYVTARDEADRVVNA